MSNHRTTLRLGRLAGVPIGIQPLWPVIVGLLTYSLGRVYFPTEDPVNIGRAVIVDAAVRPSGILSMTDIERRIQTDELRGPVPGARAGTGGT